MRILNLGCGGKTCGHADVINIDWSLSLRLHKHMFSRVLTRTFLTGARLKRFDSIPSNIYVHDLSKGIPFNDRSVDAIYHSHMLEHLDREVSDAFLREARRVLKPNGVHRIVVPDLEQLAREYLQHLDLCKAAGNPSDRREHDSYVAAIIEQCTRREAAGSKNLGPWLRRFDKFILGDARKRGETHQWMYDEISLREMLLSAGYRVTTRVDYRTSQIPNWSRYGLDTNEDASQYKPGSLYIEAVK